MSVSTAGAVAVTGGSDLGNFEIDGNMGVDTSGFLDWNAAAVKTSPMFESIIDDTLDSSFTGGQSEADWATWTCTNGNVNAKTDLVRAYVNQRVFNNHAFLDLAWVGAPTPGNSSPDLAVAFEFNQASIAQQPTVTIPGSCAVNRQVGDLLVTYDFPGGTSPVNIMLFKWSGTAWVDQNLSAANVRGANNVSGATPDLIADPTGNVSIPAERFGEATIDLTAAFTPVGGPTTCATFGTTNIRTRNSGENFSTGAQDRLPSASVDISTCGSLSIHKTDDKGHNVPGATFQAFKDAGLTMPAGTCVTDNAGECTIPNLQPGSYWVQEISAPTGYTASTAVIGPITVAANTDVLIDGTTDVTGDQVPDGFMNFRTQWELTLAQNATNLINNDHTFTATLTKSTNGGTTFAPASGQTLSFSKTGPGTFVPNVASPPCTTDGSGQCTVTITSTTTGLTTVTATFNEPGITVTTPVTLDAPATKQWVNYLLSIDGNSVNPVGNPHTFTLTLQKDTGSGFAAVGAGEIIGVSSTGTGAITGISPAGPGSSCTTNASGQCTVTVNSNVTGVLTLNANYHAVVGDTSADFPASATKQWVARTPTISTSATGPVTIGASITDTATLAGGFNPTGTITFTVYGPNDATCTGTPAGGSTVTVNGNGNYLSDPFLALLSGTYRWIAAYSGDANNNPVTGACNDTGETSTLNQAHPAVTTTPAPASGRVGTVLKDTASLTGGSNPTGNITFRLFPATDPTCSGTAVFTEAVTVNGNGHYATVGGLAANAAGTWNWTAHYSGDANNLPADSGCGQEAVTVTKYGQDPGTIDPGNPYGGDPGDTTPNTPYVPGPVTAVVVDPQNEVAGKTTPVEPAPEVLGETVQPAPAPAPAPAPLGGLLPRTGAGIAGEAMLALLLMAAGLTLRLVRRRRSAQA